MTSGSVPSSPSHGPDDAYPRPESMCDGQTRGTRQIGRQRPPASPPHAPTRPPSDPSHTRSHRHAKTKSANSRPSAPAHRAIEHRAGRLVICMEHAHAAARAVRGGYGGVLCMRVKHAACLRDADMAPRRGDLVIIAPASRCLRASIEDDGVHLGHEDERPDLLQHALVEKWLPH